VDAITQFLAKFAPSWAASRLTAQARLATAKRYYEAVNHSNFRGKHFNQNSADQSMERAKGRLRDYARYLDENHDLAVGILNDLVVNIVGSGASVEPMCRFNNGQPATALNKQLRELWLEWWERPEVTGEIPGPELERLVCRSWLRDGEIFIHHVVNDPIAQYPTAIPYLLEPLESDFVPFDLVAGDVIHGVQKDAFGRPIHYHVYKHHPSALRYGAALETHIIPASQLIHLKFTRRLHQTRGVSIFHSVLNRLDDIKEYEESERIAARVAAAMTSYIKRNGDFEATTNSDGSLDFANGSRSFEMSPGMVFDNLLPGEDVGIIKSDRPNSGLEGFRNSQLRAIAAGTETRFSSIAKDYNGTYSAQRQELVEGSLAYRRMFNVLKHVFYLPVWKRFVDTAALTGAIKLSARVDTKSLYRPEFRHPALPWIDPAKEATAFEKFLNIGVKSRHQIIRDIGGDPTIVDAQIFSDLFDPRTETNPLGIEDDTNQDNGNVSANADV